MLLTREQAARIANDLDATEGQYVEAIIDGEGGDLSVTYLTDAGTPGIGPFTLNPDGEKT
jgi:hypothetical protein